MGPVHPLNTGCHIFPKGSPLVYFYEIDFWLANIKHFPKASLAPIKINLRRARAKKNSFFGQIFLKILKTSF